MYQYIYQDSASPASVAEGDWVFIGAVGLATADNPAASPAATTAIPQNVGVAIDDYTVAGGMWVQTKGIGNAKVDGTDDVTIGDQLQLVNAAVHAVKDGGTALTVDSVAIALEAYTTGAAALKSVYIHGRAAIIG